MTVITNVPLHQHRCVGHRGSERKVEEKAVADCRTGFLLQVSVGIRKLQNRVLTPRKATAALLEGEFSIHMSSVTFS